jgi:hypothetical protein
MKFIFSMLFVMVLAGCMTTQVTTPKSTWKVLNKDAVSNIGIAKSNYVPSGTELIFTANKTFSEKENQINIELSPEKRCSMSTSFEKQPEATLAQDTVLTVVGYRGATNELVLTEPSFQQFYISCVSKTMARKTSSFKNPKMAKSDWRKSVVEKDDIVKMSPLLKVKFIPN